MHTVDVCVKGRPTFLRLSRAGRPSLYIYIYIYTHYLLIYQGAADLPEARAGAEPRRPGGGGQTIIIIIIMIIIMIIVIILMIVLL